MAQEITTAPGSALDRMTPTSKRLLNSLVEQMARGVYRDPEAFGRDLAGLGEPGLVRAALAELAEGSDKAGRRDFAVHLGRLAVQYWRPDFTPEQAKVLYGDFMRLLDGVSVKGLSDACDAWMLNPKNKFFPTPGQLRELLQDDLREIAQRKIGAERLLAAMGGDNASLDTIGPRDMGSVLSGLVRAQPERPAPINTQRAETPETRDELRETITRRMAGAKA